MRAPQTVNQQMLPPHGDCWGAGGLQEGEQGNGIGPRQLGLHRVGQDWSDLAAAAAEVYMKGMNSVIPEARIFPYVEY